jgi:ketosteroid isomerase-like protein/predicted ester cyclase
MKLSIFITLLSIILLSGACSVEEGNKSSIIKANDEMFNKGNLSYADKVFADSYAGEGPEIIKRNLGDLRTAFPDIQVTIEPLIAEGNMAAWRRVDTGTHEGVYNGFQPTDKKITWQTIIITEYDKDGMILQEWGVNDLNEKLREAVIKKNHEEVLDVSKQYMKAMKTLDVENVLAFWADDLILIREGEDINGKDELRKVLAKLYNGLKLHELKITSRDIDASENLAVEYFEYSETLSVNNGPQQTLTGKQISVWKKFDDGWKISKVTFFPSGDNDIHDSM